MDVIKGQLKGICYFVTSTFGNGTSPTSAVSLAEWLDSKLNDVEEDIYERLNTTIETQLQVEEANSSTIHTISEKTISTSERKPVRDGQIPPLISRSSKIKLGRLPSRKISIEQGKRRAGKTLSRRITMTNCAPTSSDFAELR